MNLVHLRPIRASRPTATVCGADPGAGRVLPFRDVSMDVPLPDASGNDRRCPKCWDVWRSLRDDRIDLGVRPTVPI